MEPVGLAIAAVSLLVRYGAPLLRPTAERLADEVGEALAEPLTGLLDAVRERASDDPYAAGALERWEKEPDSQQRQETLQGALTELAEADPRFAENLRDFIAMADTAERDGGSTVSGQVDDSGAVAGRDFVQNAQYAAGRDQNFGTLPPT